MFSKRENPEDLQTFIKLLTEHQANLRAFIVSLMPGSPDVDDVLQETNMVLWLKRANFELGTNYKAWSFQIARYEVHRQRERSRRHQRIMFSEELVDLLSDSNSPQTEEKNIHAALDKCMAKLTPEQYELIQERYTPGHSLEGYSTTTGRSAGSLRIALLRIRETLRHCVENTLSTES
jgi:RNA polymerase sigma-70 factor (ECF subfamily)